MLIIVYIFNAFLFWSVLPNYLFERADISHGAAAMLAICSGAMMFAVTWAVNVEAIRWLAQPNDEFDHKTLRPWKSVYFSLGGIIASCFVSYIVLAEFDPRFLRATLHRDIFGHSAENPFWFGLLLALPPVVLQFFVVSDALKTAGKRKNGEEVLAPPRNFRG